MLHQVLYTCNMSVVALTYFLCLHELCIVIYYDSTSSAHPTEGKSTMTKALQQIRPVDFSANLLRGIAWLAEEWDCPQFLTALRLESRAAHQAMAKVCEYLEALGDYELQFVTTLSGPLLVNDAWRKMLEFETTVARSMYSVYDEYFIVIRGDDLFDRMACEGAVGTIELWLECAKRFIEAYEACLVQARSTSE